MKMKSFLFISFLLFFPIILNLSCKDDGKTYYEQAFLNDNAIYNFASISDFTAAKNNLNQQLVDTYGDQANIYLFNIDNISKVKGNDYDVVLIMDSCVMDLPTGSIKSFIDSISDTSKVILFIARNAEDCGNDTSVDAITAATSDANQTEIDDIFSSISNEIDIIIAEK